MSQIYLRTPNGETPFNLPPPGDFPSFYVFAMHKSGSTLLNRMLSKALYAARVPHIAIPDLAFAAGLPENMILNPQELIFDRGYGYRGFRSFPPYLKQFDITRSKKILLVRDPRDMLVSYYFSMAYSHVLPKEGVARDYLTDQRSKAAATGVDEYCLEKVGLFQSEFRDYDAILETEIRIYRYEDVIFEKSGWLQDMLDYLDITIDPSLVASIAKENDVRPDSERPGDHIRQVTPGNFRKHLSAETIDRLNSVFSDILKRFNYQSFTTTLAENG